MSVIASQITVKLIVCSTDYSVKKTPNLSIIGPYWISGGFPSQNARNVDCFFFISWRHGAIEVQKDERWSFWTMKSYSNCPSTVHGTIYIIAKCSSMIPSCRWHVWISRYWSNKSLRDITLHCKYYFPLLYRFLTSRSSPWCYCLLLVANVGLNKIGTKI